MSFLPQRDGTDLGGAQERAMGESVGGFDTIRTAERQNGDGTWSRLHTRNGWPLFETDGSTNLAKLCLATGPLEEKPAGYGVPTDMFTLRLQHEVDPLVSTDGIFTIPRTPLKKWFAVFGEAPSYKWAEFYFSYKSYEARVIAPRPGAIRFVESPWSIRQWHPVQTAYLIEMGLTFSIGRLKQITFKTCDLTFNWGFSTEDDPTTTAVAPARMNQDGQETGLATRGLFGTNEIMQFSLILGDKLGVVTTATPGGFLDALEQSPTTPGSRESLVTDAGVSISSLSYATTFGQPWHGWLTQSGIETLLGPVVVPDAYATLVTNDADTFYFKRSDMPAPSAETPSDFASRGMQYLNDAIFFGTNKRYSPLDTCTFELGADKWLHCDSAGVVRLMRLEVYSVESDGSEAHLLIHKVGVVTTRGIVGPSVQIADFIITSPNVRPSGISGIPNLARWYQGGTFTQSFVSSQSSAPMGLTYTFPLNASPSGDRVLISHYRTHASNALGPWLDLMITSVWEITLEDDLSDYSAAQVWAVDTSNYVGVTTGVYNGNLYIHSHHHDVFYNISGIHIPTSPFTKLWKAYYNIHVSAHFSVMPTRETYVAALQAGYKTNGERTITLYELSWDSSIEFDGADADIPYLGYLYTPKSDESFGQHGETHIGGDFTGGLWCEYAYPGRVGYDEGYIGNHVGWISAETYTPTFNAFRIIDPDFTWPTTTEPSIVRYSSNLLMLHGGSSPFSDDAFISTETVENALALGTVPASFAAYDPRNKLVKVDTSLVSCI